MLTALVLQLIQCTVIPPRLAQKNLKEQSGTPNEEGKEKEEKVRLE